MKHTDTQTQRLTRIDRSLSKYVMSVVVNVSTGTAAPHSTCIEAAASVQ